MVLVASGPRSSLRQQVSPAESGLCESPLPSAPRRLVCWIGNRVVLQPAVVDRVSDNHNRLFVKGDSYHTIAAKVGHGWSFEGVRKTLRNPIWAFGTRVYPVDSHREEAYTVKVIETPLVPVEVWQAAQREMDRRKTEWRKTQGPLPRSVTSGLLFCTCGKPFYTRYASKKDRTRKKDYSYCSSAFPGRGPKCGARSWQREQVDGAVECLISETLSHASALRTILGAIAERQPQADDARGRAEREIARLEGKRARIVEMRADGLITREECAKRLSAVDHDLQTARTTASQSPAPAIDMPAIARGLAGAFATFASLPFAQKRDLLRRAVRNIVLDAAGTVPSLTLRGGFLDELLCAGAVGANVTPHCSARCWPRSARTAAT